MPLKQPTLIPELARARIAVADIPDADWAGTQVVPADALLGDVTGVGVLGVFYVAYEANGTTVSSGTLNIQIVAVGATAAGKALPYGTPIDTGVTVGALLTYDVLAASRVAVRVSAKALHVDAAYVEIYWFAQRAV